MSRGESIDPKTGEAVRRDTRTGTALQTRYRHLTEPSYKSPQLWEQEFRKLKGVGGKLDAATLLMTGETFDASLMRRADLASRLKQNHPNIGTGSANKFFVEELFRKRNKILHSGHTEFGKLEAEACVKNGDYSAQDHC